MRFHFSAFFLKRCEPDCGIEWITSSGAGKKRAEKSDRGEMLNG